MNIGCKELFEHYPDLTYLRTALQDMLAVLLAASKSGKKILLCGNGGSASDCLHIAGELMKGFTKKRPLTKEQREKLETAGMDPQMCEKFQNGIPAIPLTGQTALNTAVLNDIDPILVYAQQIYVLGQEGDVLIALSTSGNAGNVKQAVMTAKSRSMKVIGLTGEDGGWLGKNADLAIKVPASETYRIQEYHLPIYHAVCRDLEASLFE